MKLQVQQEQQQQQHRKRKHQNREGQTGQGHEKEKKKLGSKKGYAKSEKKREIGARFATRTKTTREEFEEGQGFRTAKKRKEKRSQE